MSIHHPIGSHSGKGNVTIGTREDGQHHVTVRMIASNTTAVVAMLREAIEYIDPPADYADGGVTCAAIENETDEKPTAFWEGIYRGLRDDADDARTMATLWKETAREHIGRAEVYKDWMHAAQNKAECHDCIRDAAVIEKPLTADDISAREFEAMADRALARWDEAKTVWAPRDAMREALRAALTPEPQRPEGAEEIAALLDHMPADLIGGPLTAHEARTLADHLATHGVRVTTKENR